MRDVAANKTARVVCGVQRLGGDSDWANGRFTTWNRDSTRQNGNLYPIGSMYGIYANIWGILMVNVTMYSIHGSYGYEFIQQRSGLKRHQVPGESGVVSPIHQG